MNGAGNSRPEAELIGGLERRAIVILPYQPSWPLIFDQHRRLIEACLQDRAQRIEHIGSTAVPGLPAKPIVDIQVSVKDVEAERTYIAPLEATGYVLRVREPGHRMLRTPQLDVHVHVCQAGSTWERSDLLFRDWLRTSGSDRDLYAAVKRSLAAKSWPTMNHYAEAKTEVIAAINGRAEAWASRTGWQLGQ
jgi:GrpB-like predicted nucleotidyltransferase (UPF0157 family)